MLRAEVEEDVHNLKAGKSPGVGNIPSGLLKNGGMATDLGDKGMAKGADTIAHHTFTKERQPQAM